MNEIAPNSPRSPLLDELLTEATYDWIHAPQVLSIASGIGGGNFIIYREVALGLIAEVIFGDLMVAGDIRHGEFAPWNMSPARSFQRIAKEWIDQWSGVSPPVGAIMWLRLTPKGDYMARQILDKEEAIDRGESPTDVNMRDGDV